MIIANIYTYKCFFELKTSTDSVSYFVGRTCAMVGKLCFHFCNKVYTIITTNIIISFDVNVSVKYQVYII